MMFTEQYQISASNGVVKRLFKELGYRYRKPSKVLATGYILNAMSNLKLFSP